MSIISRNENETMNAAAKFAQNLRICDVVFLHGTLGMGKSVFARALIRALSKNPDLEVPSPTFTLYQIYDTPAGAIYHYDLYRIKHEDEIYELDWEDALHSAITIVEWPERLDKYMPQKRFDITLKPIKEKENAREITIHDSQ